MPLTGKALGTHTASESADSTPALAFWNGSKGFKGELRARSSFYRFPDLTRSQRPAMAHPFPSCSFWQMLDRYLQMFVSLRTDKGVKRIRADRAEKQKGQVELKHKDRGL